MKDIETWFEFEDIPLIILGMGGGGKSQLALEFGRKVLARKDCSVVFWINASSPSTVKQSLKIVVSKLLDSKNISDDVERNLSRITAELKQKRWLAIFDNFDDPDAFHEHRLSWYFPRDGRGHILVTSRHTGSARLGKSLELSTMTEIESLALLLQRPINGIDQNPDGLKIASELGYLPLALDQAGSYIRARGVRLEDFLDHYRIRRKQILQELPSQWEYRRDTTTRTKTVCLLSAFTTWELSFEQISGDQATRKAKEHFLTISAFFDLNSISREYFKSYCEFTTGGWSQIFRRNDVWDDFEYGDVVAEYRALSLIQTRQHKHEAISEFTLHPVVQEWLKLRIDATQKQAMAEEFTFLLCIYLKSTDIVNAGLSTIGEAVANINASIMHDERFNNTPNFTTRFPLGAALILCTALSNFGHTSAAKSLGELALISSQQPSGDDELLVFILTDLVANEYELSGHTEKAFNLQKVAAARAQAQLGTDHIITIMMMRTLSRIYYAQGYESKAISLLEQMLIKVRQELGPMALDTITCLRDLGRLYYFTNRYEQAKLLLLEAWEASNEMYGCFDLTVLSIQNDLGELYANCSDWEQAEQYLNRSVTNYQDTLGPLHHLTLESQVLLARHYFRTGRFDESESILRSTLAIQADAYGAEDIQVCWTVYNLAVCLFFRGTYVGAQQLCQRLLSAYEKRYGMEKMCIQNMQKLRDLEKRIQDAMVMDEPRRISRMEEEDAMGRDVPPSEQMEDELSAIVPMPQNIQHNRNNPSKRGLSSLLKKIFH